MMSHVRTWVQLAKKSSSSRRLFIIKGYKSLWSDVFGGEECLSLLDVIPGEQGRNNDIPVRADRTQGDLCKCSQLIKIIPLQQK